MCQDESDPPRSCEDRSPRNAKLKINKTVPWVEYRFRRRESISFFSENLRRHGVGIDAVER